MPNQSEEPPLCPFVSPNSFQVGYRELFLVSNDRFLQGFKELDILQRRISKGFDGVNFERPSTQFTTLRSFWFDDR